MSEESKSGGDWQRCDRGHERGRFPADYRRRKNFFAGWGLLSADPAEWVRTQCMKLARYTKTPLDFYLDSTVRALADWIHTANENMKDQ